MRYNKQVRLHKERHGCRTWGQRECINLEVLWERATRSATGWTGKAGDVQRKAGVWRICPKEISHVISHPSFLLTSLYPPLRFSVLMKTDIKSILTQWVNEQNETVPKVSSCGTPRWATHLWSSKLSLKERAWHCLVWATWKQGGQKSQRPGVLIYARFFEPN